jgi:hypothetical protein
MSVSSIFFYRLLVKHAADTLAETVDFETFQRILNRPGGFRDPGEPEEYCRGFQVFDKDMTGFIGVGQLKYILTNLGEKMSEEEVDELLKAVDTSSGQVNYTGRRYLSCGAGRLLTRTIRARTHHSLQLEVMRRRGVTKRSWTRLATKPIYDMTVTEGIALVA